jgi:hypothetical protein
MATITDLSAAGGINAGDNLVVNQSGVDRKITAAMLFGGWTSLPVITTGIGVGSSGNKLYRPTTGVVYQAVEWATIAHNAVIVLRNDTLAYALVHVFSASHGKFATYAVEGNGLTGASRLIQGDTNVFKTTTTDGILVFALANVVYLQNFTGASLVVACMVMF